MTWRYKLKSRVEGKHIATTIFAGPKDQTLKNLGTLKFAIPDDIGAWQLFGALLKLGVDELVDTSHAEVILEGGDQVVQELPNDATG